MLEFDCHSRTHTVQYDYEADGETSDDDDDDLADSITTEPALADYITGDNNK